MGKEIALTFPSSSPHSCPESCLLPPPTPENGVPGGPGAAPGPGSHCQRWFQLAGGVPWPHLYSGHVCRVFSFYLLPNKAKLHSQLPFLSGPEEALTKCPAPPLCGPRTRGPSTPQEQGQVGQGRGLLTFSFKQKHSLIFLYKSKNGNQKDTNL